MKTQRYIRNVLLACAIAGLFVGQLTTGVLPVRNTHHSLTASHQSVLRHVSDRRLSVKSFAFALPVGGTYCPIAGTATEIHPAGIAAVARQPARSFPARSPPLS